MEILVKGLASSYEIEHLARVFFPGATLRQSGSTKGAVIYARFGRFRAVAALRSEDGRRYITYDVKMNEGEAPKTALSRALYWILRSHTNHRPPWGMLTGVRPVSLMRKTLQQGGANAWAATQEKLAEGYDVSEEKYQLTQSVVQLQQPVLAANTPRSYSLYISIPFCPTRCSYCSFVSRTIEHEGHFVPEYLQCLEGELAAFSVLAKQHALRLETIYIGGGTPTALTAAQLTTLLEAVHRHFDVAAAREFTVEAGRPDCTDSEKLRILKQFGVTRISINPQTMQDNVLREIGRRHTAADVLRCFDEARNAGHAIINMDLIAGLPGDTPAGFEDTLLGVLALAPENVTVHTLTHKRASTLVQDGLLAASPAGAMLNTAYPLLRGAGYSPYYLYRQKSTVENLENTGWAKPGREGLYNIYIMEETHSIFAAGAGGATKLVAQGTNGAAVIKRIFNHKFPADYIANFAEVLRRKKGVDEFYGRYLDTQTPG